MMGPWSSGVAPAVSEVAKRKKALHLFSDGTGDISGSRCHRYSFQWAASPYTAAKTVVDNFMKANPKASAGTCWFGALTAVNGVPLAVEAGSLHSVIGRNGAGKTTPFNLLTGTFPPTSAPTSSHWTNPPWASHL